MHTAVRADCLIDVVRQHDVFFVGKAVDSEVRLCLLRAFCGQNRIVRFFVDDIVRVDVIVRFLVIQLLDDELLHGAHQAVGALVQVADLLARARNDQRRSRLIDEDGVHLVHNRERVPALNHLLFVNDHVIPQIVEAELVVCSVGDIRRVCRVLFRVRLPMHDQTRGQPHELVNAPHLFSADAREVVVDRNDVNPLARQRVEVRGQGCNQRFAFTCFHFGNSALMQDDAAHDLHTERDAFRERGHPLPAPPQTRRAEARQAFPLPHSAP